MDVKSALKGALASSSAAPKKDEVKISIGTFNCNSQPPGNIDVDEWLHIQRDDPDILVVGIEEAEASNLAFVLWSPFVEDGWNAAIESAMGSRLCDYEKLTSKQLVGTMMLVYIRKSISHRISNLATSSVGIGVGGYLANKGATAVRFELDSDHSICFVISHLSASEGAEARERRRWDYNEIVKRLRFQLIDEGQESSDSDASGSGKERHYVRDAEAMLRAQLHNEAQWTADGRRDPFLREDVQTRQLAIMDHDVVFWAGDLNWRLELGVDEVKRLVSQKLFEGVLLNFDELRNEMQANACFQGFEEQKIA